jgi:hypothetical protein
MTQEARGNMSHVDDGTLHAYLDGELVPVERARLEAHVAECAACRTRLEEERALIERASGLLGLAQPPERSAPPLHQLRRARLAWRLRVPLAWAATVVLALGIGYYAGNERVGGVASAPEARVAANSAPLDSSTLDRRANDALGYSAGERRQLVTTTRPPAQAARQKQAEREPQAYVDGVPVESERDRAAVAMHDSIAAAAASGVVSFHPRDLRLPAAPASNAAPTARPAAPPTRALGEVVITTGSADSNAAWARGRLVATQWPIIRRGPARDILGAEPVGIPGLAVRNIRRSPTGQVVLVEQSIDSATVIQLFQERVVVAAEYLRRDARADSGLSATLQMRGAAAGTERLARFIGGVRVEIAGPLSADSLNRLLEQVKPIGP